jgi:hypothetical protein
MRDATECRNFAAILLVYEVADPRKFHRRSCLYRTQRSYQKQAETAIPPMKARWKYKLTMKSFTVRQLLVLVRFLSAALALCSAVNLANAEDRGTYTNISQSREAPEWCGIMTQSSAYDLDACRPLGTVFRDDPRLPEMVVVLGPHQAPLAVGRFEVTFDEWQRCRNDGFCRKTPHDSDWGRGSRPVINVAPREVEQFLAWMTEVSGVTYRGMTDAEWLHIAKIGSVEPATNETAHFDAEQTLEVGSLKPNAVGLYDLLGNVWEMTSECEVADYGDPRECFISRSRGGSWTNHIAYVSAYSVNALLVEEGNRLTGFRVTRDMRLYSPPPGYLDRIYPSTPVSAPAQNR